MSVVIDASVVVAMIVADPRQVVAKAALEGWLERGEELHAPAVLPFELANVLARLTFDGTVTLTEVAEIWTDLESLKVVLHPFDLGRDGPRVAEVTSRLPRRHATDATYVCLAQRLATVVWTLDGALARNAADVALPVKLLE